MANKPVRGRALVTRSVMYEMRYRLEFCGWTSREVADYYGLTMQYVKEAVRGYVTMKDLVPVESRKPEENRVR